MVIRFPTLHVGDPLRYQSLTLFPLVSGSTAAVEYRLSVEALADESATVKEVTESGSVPDLSVENTSDMRVLFLEGEELLGAKQNRVLNTSVLVGAHTKITIPVSCVEQGRWAYKSHAFHSSGSCSPSKLRYALKASVTESVRARRGHRSDQRKVWSEVRKLHTKYNVDSETAAMSDAYETYESRITDYREQLRYVEGATGVAAAVGDTLVSVDLFDQPETCETVWPRLVSSFVFDALSTEDSAKPPSVEHVAQSWEAISSAEWEQAESVGEGDEYRLKSPNGDHASALVLDEIVVHGSVVFHV